MAPGLRGRSGNVATMDLVAILAATEAVEHSDTPFLVVGGILAAFAVLVGVFGIVRHDMSESMARAIMGLGALLVVGTMVTVIAA